MNLEQIKEKCDNIIGMKSTYNSKTQELIYNSPANIELLRVKVYKNKQEEYKFYDVNCPLCNLYSKLHETLK